MSVPYKGRLGGKAAKRKPLTTVEDVREALVRTAKTRIDVLRRYYTVRFHKEDIEDLVSEALTVYLEESHRGHHKALVEARLVLKEHIERALVANLSIIPIDRQALSDAVLEEAVGDPLREPRRREEKVEDRAYWLAKTRFVALMNAMLSRVPVEELEAPDILIDALDVEELKKALDNVLDTVTFREREIVKLYFGLGDGWSYSLEQIGNIFKITRERVREILAKALRKLQHPARARMLYHFVKDPLD